LLKCWNWFDPKHQSRDAGEPAILARIVAQVQSSHNVDAARVSWAYLPVERWRSFSVRPIPIFLRPSE
jgi:hypothetical protein